MIDQFLARIPISPALVAPDESVGKETQVESENRQFPYEAWLAADRAFDSQEWSPEIDDLHRALSAAAPFIRADEIDALVRAIDVRLAQTPILGRKNNGVREGLEAVRQLLIERKSALEEAPHVLPHD